MEAALIIAHWDAGTKNTVWLFAFATRSFLWSLLFCLDRGTIAFVGDLGVEERLKMDRGFSRRYGGAWEVPGVTATISKPGEDGSQMSAFLFEISLVVAAILTIIVGQFLRSDWQKRAAMLLGALLLFGALMSLLLDLSTTLVWGRPEPSEAIEPYQPGTLIAELEEERSATLTAAAEVPLKTASAEAAIAASAEPTTAPSSPSSPSVAPTTTATALQVPTGTATPRSDSTAVDTPGPTLFDTATSVPTPTATPSLEPTRTPEPTKTSTPEPDPLRLSRNKVEPRLYVVAVSDLNTGSQTTIFELPGRPALNPIYSAAWSPDGSRVLISYRWATSDYDQGIILRTMKPDGSAVRDIFSLSTAGFYRDLGNALWLPNGDKIAFAMYDGPDNGVWVINADGSGLRRIDGSVPGEWPRYLSVNGEWLITIDGGGSLNALALEGGQRLPISSWDSSEGIYDQRYQPWRLRRGPNCDAQEDSWWKCR